MVGSWFLLICYMLCTAPLANPSNLIKIKQNAVHRTHPLPLLGTDLQVLFRQIPLPVSAHRIRWDHPHLHLIKQLQPLKILTISFTRFLGFHPSCVARFGRTTLLMQHLKYTRSNLSMITEYCITGRASISGRATNCFFSRMGGRAALATMSTISTSLLERRWPLAILPLQLVSNLDRLYSKYIQIL
jgi:hypothetical protein